MNLPTRLPEDPELVRAKFLGFPVLRHEKSLEAPSFVPYDVCAQGDYNPCEQPIYEPDRFRLSSENAQAARILTLAGWIVVLLSLIHISEPTRPY